MTAEVHPSNISPEQRFRDGHTWVTEDLLFKSGVVVIRNKEQIEDSKWHREVITVRIDAEVSKVPNVGAILEITNLYNPQGDPSDSKLVVMNADMITSRRALYLALAFGVIEAKKTPTVTQHFDKMTKTTYDMVHDFFKDVFGLKSQLFAELEDYGRFLGK